MLQDLELEQLLIGISAPAANLVHTCRGTVTMMLNVLKALSVETITAEISGLRRNQLLTAVFQVTLNQTAKENYDFV